MLRTLRLAVLASLALACSSSILHAASLTHWGPRVGLSIDPDQIVFGGQLVISDVAKDVTIDPNIEIGFGDDATVIALNGDGKYHFQIENSDWGPYAGFGIGINFISVDLPAPFDDVSDTEVGGNFIVGAAVPIRNGSHFFGELRLGLGDIPDMKIMVGWNFPK